MPEKQTYTPAEVADILSVSRYTVHEMLRDGRLKGFKLKSQWRVSRESLDAFMTPKEVADAGISD